MIPISLYKNSVSLEPKICEQDSGDLETKTTILLADDSEDVLKMLSVNLQKKGYDVLCYEDKMSAIVELKKISEQGGELPLVISDIISPLTDGFEFLRRAKELFPDIKFMFLTASREKEKISRAQSMGANAYIAKPVDLTVIYESIEQVLNSEQFFSVNV